MCLCGVFFFVFVTSLILHEYKVNYTTVERNHKEKIKRFVFLFSYYCCCCICHCECVTFLFFSTTEQAIFSFYGVYNNNGTNKYTYKRRVWNKFVMFLCTQHRNKPKCNKTFRSRKIPHVESYIFAVSRCHNGCRF